MDDVGEHRRQLFELEPELSRERMDRVLGDTAQRLFVQRVEDRDRPDAAHELGRPVLGEQMVAAGVLLLAAVRRHVAQPVREGLGACAGGHRDDGQRASTRSPSGAVT